MPSDTGGACQETYLLGVGRKAECIVVGCVAKVCEAPLGEPHIALVRVVVALQVSLQRRCGRCGVAKVAGVAVPAQDACPAPLALLCRTCYITGRSLASQQALRLDTDIYIYIYTRIYM